MNYDQMSDFEINKAVSILIGEQIAGTRRSDLSAIYIKTVSDYDGLDTITKKDYCNNPSDAWPIIDSIWDKLTSCFCYNWPSDADYWTEWDQAMDVNKTQNKLRAAMIVYLMMQESGK